MAETCAGVNQVVVPLYEFDDTGHLKPNYLFHRPIDKVHSRCIEYPFAASKMGDAKCLLDVGTAKSDPVWISWLERLPIEVYATDYDQPKVFFQNVKFRQADVRRLPFDDETFDTVLAVSVIEHIGLESPQVEARNIPAVNEDGDIEAVTELARVLKPGGSLVMTVPFGVVEGLVLWGQARNYTIASIRKFDRILELDSLDYYEYQRCLPDADLPVDDRKQFVREFRLRSWFAGLKMPRDFSSLPDTDLPGEVTWRNVPIEAAKATQLFHVEGIACGVWKKRS